MDPSAIARIVAAWGGGAWKRIVLAVSVVVVTACGSTGPTSYVPPRLPTFEAATFQIPTPSPTGTSRPTPGWNAASKDSVCRAISSLSVADTTAASLRRHVASRQWDLVDLDASGLSMTADGVLLVLNPINWESLPSGRSVAFLISYAKAYEAEATDIQAKLRVSDYAAVQLAANPLSQVGGSLQENEDALTAVFGACPLLLPGA